MKRRFLLVFATIFILCLAGCGKKAEPVTSSSSSSQPYWSQTSPASDSGASSGGASNSGSTIPTVPVIPETPKVETPKVDTDAILEELSYLAENRPEMTMDCTSCGGSGRDSVPCGTCGGSGRVLMPEITMFAAFAPCSDCSGYGYAPCSQCTFGIMFNPNYETESAEWTAERHALWHQLGYSDEEIRRIEIDEANAILGNDSGGGYSSGGGYDNSTSNETVPGICRVCYGSGKCDTCGGDRLYRNMFTGEQQECPNCTDGRCWKCGGTGQDT